MEEGQRQIQMCYNCLQDRIKSDFSDKLTLSYGISSTSALFLGNRAVVKMPSCLSGEAAWDEFVVVYLPRRPDDCLTKYVDDHNVNGLEDIKSCETASQSQSNEGCSDAVASSTSSLTKSDISSNGGRINGVVGFSCERSSCRYSGRSSCLRTITALAPCAIIGHSSISSFEEITSTLSSGSLEDDILSTLSVLIEGKGTCRSSQNFLSLIGIPYFCDDHVPGCLRHPNLVPVLGMLKSSDFVSIVFPKSPYTLENILHFNPETLSSEWHVKFLLYQLLSAINYIHGLGLGHGNICPSSVLVSNPCWTWLSICDVPFSQFESNTKDEDSSSSPLLLSSCSVKECLSQSLYNDLTLHPSLEWHRDFYMWWRGELSNFEYLLVLNRLAGRRWGDHTFHTVMPWVIDFSVKPDENSDIGWRDLSKSKWRLAKGDEQLDFTYSTSEIPHHVSDECLSELAVCSYKARRLPLSILRMAVRSVYEPNEYPSTMQRLYQWTPDECIPEFYSDHQIFYSLHTGMSDLAVPSWANTPQEFIKLHRDALESDIVSSQIHNWIDITFGYKMSGQAAVDAKNVMLPASQSSTPRTIGRRQLFTQPHPVRCGKPNKVNDQISSFNDTDYLRKIEEAAAFCEHARHLTPVYVDDVERTLESSFSVQETSCQGNASHAAEDFGKNFSINTSHVIHGDELLEYLVEEETSKGYQELLIWVEQASFSKNLNPCFAKDIFSLGCIVAELYLKRPLFDSISLSLYKEAGALPRLMASLPPHVKGLVESCIQSDWRRRPSAKSLLESPFFPVTVKSAYLFIAPFQLLAKKGTRLCYAANFAKKGAFRAMGKFAAEICATYCLPLLPNPLSDVEADYAYVLLEEFLKCLKPKAVTRLVLPAIQKILQATDYSHLKVSLLQDSFVRKVWQHIGKQMYLEKLHPLVISNLISSPHKSTASAASVLLISSSEELGVPVTIQQTILPLINCFGKGLCSDGIDALVRIGVILGENFIVTQIVPLLKSVVLSCVDTSHVNKPEPVQSWNSLALVDCLLALDSLIRFLGKEVLLKELIEGQSSLFVMILRQSKLELPVLQAAATTLLAVCQQIGPDFTALHVLPQLKELFNELVYPQELFNRPNLSKLKEDKEVHIENHMDLVLILYPSLASLLGIERLRQSCGTWLLLEQYLQRHYNWEWEFAGNSSGGGSILDEKRVMDRGNTTSRYNPSKLLRNGVGWAVPQLQGTQGGKDLVLQKRFYEIHQKAAEGNSAVSKVGKRAPWFWFSSPAAGWDGPDFLARSGSLKDELPWKIRASIMYSVRAHQGALRTLAVDQDECTVFTAGVGPGFKGTVQKWDLSTVDCVSGYYGHEEVVNDICILSSSGRVASCDGTIHVWNSLTGKVLSVIAESSVNSVQASSFSTSPLRINNDQASMLNSYSLSTGILSGIDGSLYTCMHFLDSEERLLAGTGNGSLRFVDAARGEKLHLWSSESTESGFASIVSAICSCSSEKMRVSSHSLIAMGLSSGNCRLLDARSGNVVASWRAHDGYVTKLAAPEPHFLISSSLDKTIRIWDLRKSFPPQPIVYKGHSDSILDFSVWGQDVISISKNKIGLSSLNGIVDEDGQNRVVTQALHTEDRGARNMSVLSSIAILPFSRLFAVGTEDGHLKICS